MVRKNGLMKLLTFGDQGIKAHYGDGRVTKTTAIASSPRVRPEAYVLLIRVGRLGKGLI